MRRLHGLGGGFLREVAAAALISAFLPAFPAAQAEEGTGDTRGTLQWEGRERSYLMHVPAVAGNEPRPLVIALHGAGQDAAAFAAESHFANEAEANRVIVVFPDGTGTSPGKRSWNAHFCCGPAITQQVDDIGFIGALIDRIAAQLPIDQAVAEKLARVEGSAAAARSLPQMFDLSERRRA
jgi:poly(3-hydroxybutyrate) depolymerase